jgi:signal transduction histidine kinase
VTVGELRELAHGIYPPLLRDRGIAEALRAAANRSPLATIVETDELGRFDTELEAAVYFCCLEAMQNAGKHAGEGSTITIVVRREADEVFFSIADDGAGFDTTAFAGGHGFENMGDRLGAIGGRLQVESTVGVGTTISGWLPVPE